MQVEFFVPTEKRRKKEKKEKKEEKVSLKMRIKTK